MQEVSSETGRGAAQGGARPTTEEIRSAKWKCSTSDEGEIIGTRSIIEIQDKHFQEWQHQFRWRPEFPGHWPKAKSQEPARNEKPGRSRIWPEDVSDRFQAEADCKQGSRRSLSLLSWRLPREEFSDTTENVEIRPSVWSNIQNTSKINNQRFRKQKKDFETNGVWNPPGLSKKHQATQSISVTEHFENADVIKKAQEHEIWEAFERGSPYEVELTKQELQ